MCELVVEYDRVGARTFAFLLYTVDRHEGALYWWRFAAGAGDLLAAYHAAVGSVPDARVWRAFSRMLGYTEQHVPQPVRVPRYLFRGPGGGPLASGPGMAVPPVEGMTWGVVSPGPRGVVGDADERSDYRLAWRNARHPAGGRSA